MPRFWTSAFAFILLSVLPATAWAQRVYWDPPGGRLGVGKTEPVSLVFEDCSPAEGFRLPDVSGLDFGEPSESQQTSIVNFQMTSRVVLTYPVRASEKGSMIIPAFDAQTNKGKIAVGEVRFEASEAGIGPTGIAIGEIVSSQLKPARTSVWAGEVVPFEYMLSASSRYNVSIAGEPAWTPTGWVIEPFGPHERTDVTVGGERRQAVRYRTRGLFAEPRQVLLDPVRQLVNVQTGERAVGFFSQPRIEQFTINSDTPAIAVKALPQPAPHGFRGAVGNFILESTIVPQTARIGEPITWTLTLSGSGNWTTGLTLPEREVSTDFQVVQPKTRTEMQQDRLFDGKMIEDAVLVPTAAGAYSLGPVSFTFFDPTAGQYRTQTVPAVTVTIDPVQAGLNGAAGQGAPSAGGPAESSTPGLPGSSVASPPPPLPGDLPPTARLPGDPLPVGTRAAAPRRLPMIWLIAVPVAAPLLFWAAMAVAHAVRTDPSRERRQALREVIRLLGSSGRAPATPDHGTLERWRTLVARVWEVRRATPTSDDLATAISSVPGAKHPDEWVALWREAEGAMFSPRAALPSNWTSRALEAARKTRILRGAAWWPGRRRNWAPQILLLALVAQIAFPPSAEAAEARDVYREGRFAEAHDAWVAHLRRQPDDWAAHYNIALTAAQLDAWAEANAHAAAAFLLHPRSPFVAQQLRFTATQMQGLDPAVRRLIDAPWYERALVWLSPGEWQNLTIGGAIVVGLALLTLIASLYQAGNRVATKAAGQAMLLVGLAVIATSTTALWQYGPLRHPQAAMVVSPAQLLSIPTDAAEKQKSVPISPGTIVVIQRSFLGWDKVAGHADTAGWIRREAIVPFYLPPVLEPDDIGGNATR